MHYPSDLSVRCAGCSMSPLQRQPHLLMVVLSRLGDSSRSVISEAGDRVFTTRGVGAVRHRLTPGRAEVRPSVDNTLDRIKF